MLYNNEGAELSMQVRRDKTDTEDREKWRVVRRRKDYGYGWYHLVKKRLGNFYCCWKFELVLTSSKF